MKPDCVTFMASGTLKLREVLAWFQNEDPAHDFRLAPDLRCDADEGNCSMRPDSNAMANDSDADRDADARQRRAAIQRRGFASELERNLATIAAMQRDVEQAKEERRIAERDARRAGTPLPNKRRERAMKLALERAKDGRTREGRASRREAWIPWDEQCRAAALLRGPEPKPEPPEYLSWPVTRQEPEN